MDIERLIVESFNKVGFSFSSMDNLSSLIELEACKRKILLDRENQAR